MSPSSEKDSLSTTVVTWSLKPSNNNQPAQHTLAIGPTADGNETALFDDARKLVEPVDIKPGGKYYSIVKLQIRYEKQDASDTRWAQGTGWLIDSNLLVTAGHCAFDHTYRLGRAVQVKAYVGYNGKESIGSPDVQFREGSRILTTSGWLQDAAHRDNDVSFIKFEKGFDNTVPFRYDPTPTKTQSPLTLGVVGYPADKTYKDEAAAQMYFQYRKTSFDLDTSIMNMLEYTISSFGGQSGSPVLIKDKNTAIGTHVYGLGNKNSASVIRGHYGNFYQSYVDTLRQAIPPPPAGKLFTTLTTVAEDAMIASSASSAEDFWSTLKQVANVGANVGQAVLNIGSPFLGPVGAPIAAVAGTCLGFVSKVTGTESVMSNDYPYKHEACRAVLSEAALQTVLKMNTTRATQYGIFEKMQTAYSKNKPYVASAARVVGPALIEPALRIALNSTAPPPAGAVQYPAITPPPKTESSVETPGSRLAQGIRDTAEDKGDSEGFLEFLGNVVNTAVTIASPVLGAVGSIVTAIGGESSMEPADSRLQRHFETVCNRALMGDAALQAILELSPEQIQQEGFFSTIGDAIQSIGRTVVKVAPNVIRVVEPLVHEAIQKKLNPGGESSFPSGAPLTNPNPTSTGSVLEALGNPSLTSPPVAPPGPPPPPGASRSIVNGVSNAGGSKVSDLLTNASAAPIAAVG